MKSLSEFSLEETGRWKEWDKYHMGLAIAAAAKSKDPSSKVGAVIAGPDHETRVTGFNGFPRGIADTPERLLTRELKYTLIVHAEVNALLTAARVGIPTKDCTLYVSFGCPCTRCALEIIQAGIVRVVTLPFATLPDRWKPNMSKARDILWEAGVTVTEVNV